MALTVKSLLSGQLSGAALTYNPAAGKGAVIKNILLTNRTQGASTATAVLDNANAGHPFNLCPPGISIPGNSTLVLDAEITLSSTETLRITGTGTIDCVVNGVECDN